MEWLSILNELLKTGPLGWLVGAIGLFAMSGWVAAYFLFRMMLARYDTNVVLWQQTAAALNNFAALLRERATIMERLVELNEQLEKHLKQRSVE